MGAAASAQRPVAEPTALELSGLGQPVKKGDSDMLIFCLPQSPEMKKKSPTMLLEVGTTGFRLLRPESMDCLYLYPWGQIHSWSHADSKFTFRYFDDTKKTVVQYAVFMRDIKPTLEHIQVIIEKILEGRKNTAISDAKFADLSKKLAGTPAAHQLDVLLAATKEHYFWAEQGKQCLDILPSSFDKVEGATVLHGRLIDQNRFSYMLESLESPADRDNVWHRITTLKKQQSSKGAGKSSTPSA